MWENDEKGWEMASREIQYVEKLREEKAYL